MASEPVGHRDGSADRGSWAAHEGSDHGLAWHVGHAVLARARSVLARGCVLDCEQVAPGELLATVEGTRPWPYQVSVDFVMAGGRVGAFEAECDCPVQLDCKHAVAALLHHLAVAPAAPPAARSVPAPPSTPEWERSLGHLLGASIRPSGERERSQTPLGLQVSMPPQRRRGAFEAVAVRIRPIQRNARDRWVSSGVSWRDMRYGYFTTHYQPEQLECLRALADLELRRNPYQSLGAWIGVDGPGGSHFWDALAQAQRVGVELQLTGETGRAGDRPSGHGRTVELSVEPAELVLDLARDGDLRLTPIFRLANRALDPAGLRLIGEPPHGLVLDRGDRERDASPVTLVGLRRPLTQDLAGLLESGPVTIPSGDEIRFLAEFAPMLRRRVTLVSADGSVVIPEPMPPKLVLTVTRERGHVARLWWGWQEDTGRRRELADDLGLPAADRDAMRRAIDELLALGVLPGALLGSAATGPVLRHRHTLEGAETVAFMTKVWPALAEHPGVITELDGEDVDLHYRPSTADPVLQVDGDEDTSRDWFDLAVRVTVDGEDVPFGLIFRALAGEGSMLILPSGTYVALDERWDRLRELIEESRSMHDAEPGELRIDRYTASRWSDLEESGLLGAHAARWRERIRAVAVGLSDPDGTVEPAPAPPGLQAELRGYQRDGLAWLRERFDQGLGGILADDMGLGKTVQMLGLVAHARSTDPSGPPLLVVAPTSVIANWVAEAARFTPGLRVVPVTLGGARRGGTLADAVRGADLVVTSYQLFRLGIQEYRELSWSGLILDEAQFVKNAQSKGFRCARDFPAPVTFAVTGTPLENNLMELWALLAIAVPGLFPDPRPFTEYYRAPIERGGSPERLAQLRRRTAPFLLRRTKEQVAPDLPPKLEQVVELDLSPRHQQVYQRHLQRERQKILGLLQDEKSLDDNRFQILRSLTLLRQLSLDPSLIDESYRDIPSSKLDVVMDRIAEIVGSGHRVLVFSQFTRFLARARDQLDTLGIAHCLLDGRTRDRAGVVEAFRSGVAPVFLISLKAGGFGLNLTEADYCILLDPWWNPAAEAQAIDRTHRIGQTKNVIVYRYVAKSTIEEKVMALKAGKAKLFDDVLGPAGAGGGPGRAALTAAEIRDLIA